MKATPEILLVDDNPADIDLTGEVLARSEQHSHVNAVNDGAEAISFLRQQGKYSGAPSPDLVVLDLNLPRKSGQEVLAEIKSDPKLKKIPVIIFTTSQADADVVRSYELGANGYLRKPGNLADFVAVVEATANFWLGITILPQKETR